MYRVRHVGLIGMAPRRMSCTCWTFHALAVDGQFDPVDSTKELRLVVGDSVTAVLGGTVTTNQPSWIAAWRDEPDPT